MKIKVSEATNTQLNWLVATALGKRPSMFIFQQTGTLAVEHNYSTDWVQGGLIIERESICLEERKRMGVWLAYTRCLQTSESNLMNYGSTPLIAVMRCFVTSKLGNEVEVPNELV